MSFIIVFRNNVFAVKQSEYPIIQQSIVSYLGLT